MRANTIVVCRRIAGAFRRGLRDGSAPGTSTELSSPAGEARGALRAWRPERHRRAHPGAEAHRGARRTVLCREHARRRRHHRHGAAAHASGDGYTLLVANQDFIVQPIIKAKVPYDPFKSFAPITLVVTAPEMIVVHPSIPVKDVKELIALLKANPGKYSYASPGYGTTPHLVLPSGYSKSTTVSRLLTCRSRAPRRQRSRRSPGRRRSSITCCRPSRRTSRPAPCGRSRSPPPSARRNSPTCRRSAKPAFRATRSDFGWACSPAPGRRSRSSTC